MKINFRATTERFLFDVYGTLLNTGYGVAYDGKKRDIRLSIYPRRKIGKKLYFVHSHKMCQVMERGHDLTCTLREGHDGPHLWIHWDDWDVVEECLRRNSTKLGRCQPGWPQWWSS